jgi:glutathione S-transferase
MHPHIVLHETGAKFDAVKVDLASHKTEKGEDYYAVNPKGAVPALQLDNGDILTEGAAIAQYIGDHANGSTIMPKAGSADRYKEIEWLNWIATELHKGFSPLWNKDHAAKAGDIVKGNLAKRLAHLDKHLAGRDFILGNTFTAADAYAFTILGWAPHTGVDLSGYKNLGAYLGRIAARPAVQATLKAEGLAK